MLAVIASLARADNDSTPFHHAVEHSRLSALQALMSIRGDPGVLDLRDRRGYSVVLRSASLQRSDRDAPPAALPMLKYILDHYSVEKPDGTQWKMVPIQHAIRSGNAAAVMLILQYPPDGGASQVNAFGNTALHVAARHGRTEMFEAMLRVYPLGAFQPNLDGLTPLHYAAEYGHVGIVRCLLQRNAHSVWLQDCDGRTALAYLKDRYTTNWGGNHPPGVEEVEQLLEDYQEFGHAIE